MKQKLFYLFIAILIILTGCNDSNKQSTSNSSTSSDTKEELRIGVIGNQPDVNENNVSFVDIELTDLKKEQELSSLNAIFIMKDHLSEAADSQYASVYKKLKIPTFFIESTKGYVPFVTEDLTYEGAPDMDNTSYATGFLNTGKVYNYWEYNLNNDKLNDKNIKEVYNNIFDTIISLKQDE